MTILMGVAFLTCARKPVPHASWWWSYLLRIEEILTP
jgi:hypothetical protein